jgi:hypothetical protein
MFNESCGNSSCAFEAESCLANTLAGVMKMRAPSTNRPERMFSEENQQLEIKHESQLLFRIHPLFGVPAPQN